MKLKNEELSKDETYLKPSEAGGIMRRSVGTLANYRSENKGPEYIKMHGQILYSLTDVLEYLESRKVRLD